MPVNRKTVAENISSPDALRRLSRVVLILPLDETLLEGKWHSSTSLVTMKFATTARIP